MASPPQIILIDDLPETNGYSRVVGASNPDAPCSIYFTSGSTGKPKAILGRLKGIDHFIRWEIEAVSAGPGTRVSQLASPSFDGFLKDAFVPLCSGGVVCAPESREIILEAGKLWRGDVGVALNFDARGNTRPVMMFETSENNGWLIDQFAEAAPYPVAHSLSYELYRLLPNDTDLTLFKKAGIPGLNFANIDGIEHYHTPLDNRQDVDQETLQYRGSYALALARHRGDFYFSLAHVVLFTRTGLMLSSPEKESRGFVDIVVLSLCALPAIIVMAPVIYQIFVGLTLNWSFMVIALLVLLFGLLLPQLRLIATPFKWVFPGAAAVAAIVLLVAGVLINAAPAERQPNRIVYALNTDTGRAIWAGDLSQPDERTSQFFAAASEKGTLAEFAYGS